MSMQPQGPETATANQPHAVAIIDRFFVLDFDRCLGDTEKLQNLFEEVAVRNSLISSTILQKDRQQTEQTGGSFDTVTYLQEKTHVTDLAWANVAETFIREARQNDMLEPGARELLDFLYQNNLAYGILTYGGELWQKAKLAAARLDKTPTLITDIKQKGSIIAGWQESGGFRIPPQLRGEATIAKRITFIDDKPVSFEGLPIGVDGIHVSWSSTPRSLTLPANVVSVVNLHDVLGIVRETQTHKSIIDKT